MQTSPVFNVLKIFTYYGELPSTATNVPEFAATPNQHDRHDQIVGIVDIRELVTRRGISRRYPVCWRDRPLYECT